MVHSEDEARPVASLNVFQISKALKALGISRPKSVNRYRSGDLLIEVSSADESSRLGNAEHFGGLPVNVEPHETLNSSKGVIKSRDLDTCSEADLVSELKGVTAARRIIVRRGEKEIKTNTWVLTFDVPRPPSTLIVEYLSLAVRPFVPNPMRCFGCHRFGHTRTRCRREAVCPRCGEAGHSEEKCSSEARCLNCKGGHPATSKECPKWREEKAVLEYKAQYGGTFSQARAAVFPTLSASVRGKSYADAVRIKSSTVPSSQPTANKGSTKQSPQKIKRNNLTPRGDGSVSKKVGDRSVPTKNRFSVLGTDEEEMDLGPSPSSSQGPSSSRPSTPPPSLLSLTTTPPFTPVPPTPEPRPSPKPTPPQPNSPDPIPPPKPPPTPRQDTINKKPPSTSSSQKRESREVNKSEKKAVPPRERTPKKHGGLKPGAQPTLNNKE